MTSREDSIERERERERGGERGICMDLRSLAQLFMGQFARRGSKEMSVI